MRATTDRPTMRRAQAHANRASSTGPAQRPGGFADPRTAGQAQGGPDNERFRLLFERASVGILSVDQEGRAVEANPAVERMLGYGPGEMIGVSFATFTHADDVAGSEQSYREMVENGRASYQYEKRLVRRDGEIIWCRVGVWTESGAPGSGQVAIAMIEDVTQRKLAEFALQEKAS